MNSFERVITAISHKTPDRAPLFLLFSLYGAKESDVSIKKYFENPEMVARAQILMKEKYSTDCYYTFSYAACEIESFGGEVNFVDDGPPNAGEPFLKDIEKIGTLVLPEIQSCPSLTRVLETTSILSKASSGNTPIIGVVMSPFSLPVMQLGFENYLKLLYYRRDDFWKLMNINQEFCVNWANAQVAAGANAICYFDPLASPNIIERPTYIETGYVVARNTINRIKAPVATHLASGITLPVIDDIIRTGSAVVGFSASDDIGMMKEKTAGKICLLGNLNAVEMVRMKEEQIRKNISDLFNKAGESGGLIIADNHGEIPWQISENTLMEISEAVKDLCSYRDA